MAYITYHSMNVQIIVYHMFVHAIGHFAVLSPGALEKECHFLGLQPQKLQVLSNCCRPRRATPTFQPNLIRPYNDIYITKFILYIYIYIITGVSLEFRVAGISNVAGGHFSRACARARNLWYFGSKCYHVFSFATRILMW